jgi:hypothetical protein
MAGLATIATLLGGVVSAVGTVASGMAEKRNADFEAKQLEMKGKEDLAASQREALDKKREAALVNSRAQALAAASGAGAGADAPTIVKLMAETAGQGDYNARTVMYGGESRKRGLFDQAKGRRAQGRASLLGSVIGGFGSALGGVAKAYG